MIANARNSPGSLDDLPSDLRNLHDGFVSLPRLASLLLVALSVCVSTAACDDTSAGPLTLRGDGMVVDPVDTDVWFKMSGCLREGEDPSDVMITNVTTSPTGQDDHVTTRVAWYDDTPDMLAKPGQPPAAYRLITESSHSGGTLDGCTLDIAVLFSSGATDPVIVRSVNVDYEVDGEAYSTQTSLDAVLCPNGTHASSHGPDCTTDAASGPSS